ncbi:hypothetical protein D3C73_1113280 [compost metagenome]
MRHGGAVVWWRTALRRYERSCRARPRPAARAAFWGLRNVPNFWAYAMRQILGHTQRANLWTYAMHHIFRLMQCATSSRLCNVPIFGPTQCANFWALLCIVGWVKRVRACAKATTTNARNPSSPHLNTPAPDHKYSATLPHAHWPQSTTTYDGRVPCGPESPRNGA